MTLPRAWMLQAESDLRAAERVDNPADARTRCQAISKYQQCVEKSVKGVLDRLFAAGLITQGSDGGHHVPRYAALLGGLPATRDSRPLLNQLRRLITKRRLDQIAFHDSLVPAYPAKGALAKWNHEYPYQDAAGDWCAPSDRGSFTAGELKRVRACAVPMVSGLRQILDALDLLYP